MIEDSSEKMLEFLRQSGPCNTEKIAKYLGVSESMVSRKTRRMIKSGVLVKGGKHPDITYEIASPKIEGESSQTPLNTVKPTPQQLTAQASKSNPDELPPWLKWIGKFGIDINRVRAKYVKMYSFFYRDSERLVSSRIIYNPSYGSSVIESLIKKVAQCLIWIAAVVVVCFGQMKEGLKDKNSKAASQSFLLLVIILGVAVAIFMVLNLPKYLREHRAINQMQEQLTKIKGDWLKMRLELENSKAELSQTQRTLQFRENYLKMANDQLADSQKAFSQSQNELLKAQNDLYAFKTELSNNHGQLASEQQQKNDLILRLGQAKDDVQALKADKGQLNSQLQDEQVKTKRLENQIDQINQEYLQKKNEFEAQLRQEQAKTKHLEAQIDQINREYLQKKNEFDVQLQQEQSRSKQFEEQLRAAVQNQPIQPIQSIQSIPAVELEHISMEKVVQWTKQGESDQEIISRIKQSHSTYALTSEDIGWLHQKYVSEKVIAAMQEGR